MSAAHTIRPARLEDAPALQQIYAHYVEQTAYSFEYQPPTPQEFQARIAATLQAYPYLVADVEGTPLGYAYAGRMRSREAYDWVGGNHRLPGPQAIGQGLGRALYDALLPQWPAKGCKRPMPVSPPITLAASISINIWALWRRVTSSVAAIRWANGGMWSGWPWTWAASLARLRRCAHGDRS